MLAAVCEFVTATHPEIAEFLRDHVQGNVPLPYAEVFAKVGVEFDPAAGVLSVNEGASPAQLSLREAWSR